MIRVPCIVICFTLFSSSCERIAQKNKVDSIESVKTELRINLKDNIKSLIPSTHANESEEFLYTQLYEPLFSKNHNGGVDSQLIQSVSLDSSNNVYRFSLHKGRKFSNGSPVTTGHIYNCLKRAIDHESDSIIKLFQTNIVGYQQYSKIKSLGILNDSLPTGIKIHDDFSFSLVTIKPDRSLLETLSTMYFLIFEKNPPKNPVGTGPFMVEYSNDDISLNLVRNPYYEVTNQPGSVGRVNIRFIKNDQALTNEFINGSIDIIKYTKTETASKSLQRIINKKYGFKSFVEQKQASVQFMGFKNIQEGIVQLILDGIEPNRSKNYILKTQQNGHWKFVQHTPKSDSAFNQASIVTNDTTKILSIPVFNKTTDDCAQMINIANRNLPENIQLVENETEDINLKSEYIVIQESKLEKVYDDITESMLKTLISSESSEDRIEAIAVIQSQHDLVIFDERISGFTKYGNWAYDIKNLIFSQPKTY